MDIYYFESEGQGYICKNWRQYAKKETHGKDHYRFSNYHAVNRKPTLEEADRIYHLLVSSRELFGVFDFEPVLLSPAPTGVAGNKAIDWNAEATRQWELRESAMEHLQGMDIPEKPMAIQRTRLTCYNWVWKKDGCVFAANGDTTKPDLYNIIDTHSLVNIIVNVQKAIAERTVNP